MQYYAAFAKTEPDLYELKLQPSSGIITWKDQTAEEYI